MSADTEVTGPVARVDLFDVLRRWGVRILLATVVGALLGLAAVRALPPSYEVTVELLVGPAVADTEVLEGASDLARTYAEVVESDAAVDVAAEAAETEPDDVAIRATAGRGSSTLEITVRTPDEAATEAAAARLVRWLSTVVEGASAGVDTSDGAVELGGTGLADVGSRYPGGSVLVVLDDGTGDVIDSSLGEPVGVVAGALVGALLLGSLALDREHRRASWQDVRGLGRDLGPLRVAPRRAFAMPRAGLPVARGRRADLDVQRIAAHVFGQADDVVPVIFVGAAPSVTGPLGSVLLQLCRATGSPATIVDPAGLIAPQLGTVGSLRGITHDVLVKREQVAQLVVPRRAIAVGIRTPEDVREFCRSLDPAPSAVFVSMPVSDRHPTWPAWAAGADCAVLLASVADPIESVREVTDRIRLAQPRFTGVVRVERRWLRGRVRRARVGVPTAPTAAGGREEPERVEARP